MLFDNTVRVPLIIAFHKFGRLEILDQDRYDSLKAQYGKN